MLATLQQLEEQHGHLTVASDFDGTLTDDTGEIPPELMKYLAQRLNAGPLDLCLITGRGRSSMEAFLQPLVDAGLTDAGRKHLKILMYNGGLGTEASDLVLTGKKTGTIGRF